MFCNLIILFRPRPLGPTIFLIKLLIINYHRFITNMDLPKLLKLTQALSSRPDMVHSVDSWVPLFVDFVDGNRFLSDPFLVGKHSDAFLQKRLTQFLFSKKGARFMREFGFQDGVTLECGVATPKVVVSSTKTRIVFVLLFDFFIFLS